MAPSEDWRTLKAPHHISVFAVERGPSTGLPVDLRSESYRFGDESVPSLHAPASQVRSGRIRISVCNLDPQRSAELTCSLQGAKAGDVRERVLAAQTMTADNIFGDPETVRPGDFDGVRRAGDGLVANPPAKSLVVLEVA